MLGQHDDLPDVVGIVRQLPVDGLHHRVILAADGHRAYQIDLAQRTQRAPHAIPTFLPQLHQLRARGRGLDELAVPLAERLLAVGGQEIRPSRPHVARHVFDDECDGIHLAVQRDGEFPIGDLRHRVFGQFLVITKKRKGIFQVRRGELECHASIIRDSARTAPCYNKNFHNMLDESIQELASRSLARIASAASPEALEAVRVDAVGRKGALAEISQGMGKLSPEERKRIGQVLNAAKQQLEAALEARKAQFDDAALRARLDAEWVDLTLPAPGPRRGHLHPITRIQRELEDLFVSLGFTVLDGPEVETEYYNFDALNIPPDHPARDMQDTFWLDGGNLLRTHTSPVQVRGMERLGPPLRMIAPGRVFRNESVDASHEHTFYQLEGMMIDRDVSVAHLLYFMKTLLTAIFQRDVTVRLRPGYFPFVEPGFELDIECLICGGPGCPVCKHSGWVELLPCGLVNPYVLRTSGIDPDQWGGFAFGLGLTRLVMMRYGIDDIRHLQGGDLRFLEQF